MTPLSDENEPCAGLLNAEHASAVHVGMAAGDHAPPAWHVKLVAPLTLYPAAQLNVTTSPAAAASAENEPCTGLVSEHVAVRNSSSKC